MNYKPPLGACPCDMVAFERIKVLADAISRYANEGYSYKSIEKWANEILDQCKLIEKYKSSPNWIKEIFNEVEKL